MFPNYKNGPIVFNEKAQFCFSRMNLVNCNCFKCQGLLKTQIFINQWKSRFPQFHDFDGPDTNGAPCSFEKQAYENELWKRKQNPERLKKLSEQIEKR